MARHLRGVRFHAQPAVSQQPQRHLQRRGPGARRGLKRRRAGGRFPGVRISVPPAVVIATDMFDLFLAENNLSDFALHCDDDGEIQQRFLDATLPMPLQENLKAFLAEVDYPLAVRSSSLLEDSQYQPF